MISTYVALPSRSANDGAVAETLGIAKIYSECSHTVDIAKLEQGNNRMNSAVSTIGTTIVATYAFLGIFVTWRAIGAACGIFASNNIVAHEIDSRLSAITRATTGEHNDLQASWRDRQTLKSAQRMLRHHGHMSRRMSTYRLLPFCADLSDMVAGFSREVAQAEYRGRLLAYPFRQRIRAETTLAGLATHYRIYRHHRRRVLIASALGPRRLVRGRAPRCAVYWKKLFSYTGRGGGVGVLISYLSAGSVISHFPLPLLGGVIALFAFLVKALTIWAHSFRHPWLREKFPVDRLMTRQPFWIALFLSAAAIAIISGVRLLINI